MMGANVQPTLRSGRRARVFAHREDKHCAIYNVVVWFAYGAAFAIYLNPAAAGIEDTLGLVAFTLGAGGLLGWISGVNVGVNYHNHAHRPIFRSDFLNLWFERLWTFSGGWPAFYWKHSHVTVHHANLLGDGDWTMPKRRADGRFENIYLYVFCHWPWRFVPHLLRDFRAAPAGSWLRRKATKEGLIFLALWSVPFWIDPVMALALWVFPQWVANAVIMGSGMYVQHADCTPKSDEVPYRHSNSFVSRFFNLTMFNIGYHVEHHDHAQVHWSALPALHERLRARQLTAGVHVVPYGYFHAASICSAVGRTEAGFDRFASDQAEGYRAPEAPGTEIPANAPASAAASNA